MKTEVRLYVILDTAVAANRDIKALAQALEQGGANYIQLRDKISPRAQTTKTARSIMQTLRGTARFIINDSVDAAAESGADGVHLGQADGSIDDARKILGKEKIIGRTCKTIAQCLTAEQEGADYIGMGAAFATSTKTDTWVIPHATIADAAKSVHLPVFAIGGINNSNCTQLAAIGVRNICLCSAVITAADPAAELRRIRQLMENTE